MLIKSRIGSGRKNRGMSCKNVTIITIIVGISFSGSGVFAGQTEYVGQNVIDTLVDRAFYILNSAEDPSSGMSQEDAVSSAKSIAAKLRNIAKNDRNRKYILLRTGELENQIYLEEEGLLKEKEKYRQKSANDLIPLFNAELGKPRPDFKNLWSIRKKMAGVDANMAIDVENSIRKRGNALAKEVPYLFETYLNDSKIDDARAELAYCQVNSGYLGLSPSRYATLEAKLNAKAKVNDEREQVVKGLQRFNVALKTNDLNNASVENQFLSGKIKALRSNIQSYEWVRLNKDYELYASKYDRKTDSLCNIATGLLRSKGPYAASAFLDTMRTIGLTIDKVNKIDRMILETVVAERLRAEDLAMSGKPSSMAGDTAPEQKNDPMLADLMALAKKRTQEKKDSQAVSLKSRGSTTQIEEVRKDRLRVAFQLRQMREQDEKETGNAAALRALVDIYTCIEIHQQKDALKRFAASKEMLKKNLPKEDYDRMAEVVKNGEGEAAAKQEQSQRSSSKKP